MMRLSSIVVLCLAVLPCLAAEPPLSYEAALNAIIARDPDVQSQKVALDQVKAKNLPSKLGLLPTVSLVGERTENQSTAPYQDPFGNFFTQNYQSDRLGANASLGLNLFHFGSDIAGMHAATSEESSQSFVITDQVLKTEGVGAKALNSAILAQKEVEIQRRILEDHTNVLGIARARYRRGLTAQQEVDKVAVDLDNDQAQLRDAEAEAIRARADLTRLLGTDNIQMEWPWTERLRQGPPAILQVTESALAERPDWKAEEAKIKGARERQSQNLGQMLPSLDFKLTYGYYHTIPSVGPNYNGPEFSGALQLTIPLFDHLVGYSSYATQVQAVSLAELEFEKLKRQARSDWESARGALEISLQTAKARDQTVEVSRRLYQANLLRFERGLVTANDLSVDQQRLFSSERLAVQGWSAAHSNFVTLCNALGRRVAECWR